MTAEYLSNVMFGIFFSAMWKIAGLSFAVILLSAQCANAAADDDDDADSLRDSASRPQLSRAAVERVPLQFERYGSPHQPPSPTTWDSDDSVRLFDSLVTIFVSFY